MDKKLLNYLSRYRFKIGIIVIILLLALFLFLRNSWNIDKFDDVDLPTYPDSYSLRSGFNTESNCKYTVAKVKSKFPAEDVVQYLIDEFEKMNFLDYRGDGKGAKMWENFDPHSGRWVHTDKPPARFIASWIDKEGKRLFLLQMFYKYDGKNKDWQNTLLVDCSVCKYSKVFESSEPPKAVQEKMRKREINPQSKEKEGSGT